MTIDQYGLYDATGEDWNVTITISLTEPVCTCINISPEGYSMTRYIRWVDRDEDVMLETQRLIELVKAEVVDKIPSNPSAPFTNPDDANFEKWLAESGKFPLAAGGEG